MKAAKFISVILAVIIAISVTVIDVSALGFNDSSLVSSKTVNVPAGLYTKSYSLLSSGRWYHENRWNWNAVSDISDFIDQNGLYTTAYVRGSDIIVDHYSDMSISSSVTLKKPMPLVGGVICDSYGNYYVAAGRKDEQGLGGVVTFAIYKYSPDGTCIGKCAYLSQGGSFDTKIPFDAGNCAMTFDGSVLVCSYAREMYSGHQSNAVFAVDTERMVEVSGYNCYASHSFNQSVITLSDGSVVFANHGDAFPRSMQVVVSKKNGSSRINTEFSPIHIAGKMGDNYTNAKLTGITELRSGIALAGSLGDINDDTNKQEMFVKIISAATGESVINGASRSGTSAGESFTDTGILWLTSYKGSYAIGATAMTAVSSDKLLVMWEKCTSDYRYLETCYSVICADGSILVDSASIGSVRLNGCEELKCVGGKVMWTYTDGNGYAQINSMSANF